MSLIKGGTGTRRTHSSSSLAGQLGSALADRAAGSVTTAASSGIRLLEEALGLRFDPAPAYLFYVELSGVIVALFTECDGLGAERDVEDVEEGGVNNFVHKLPGRLKFGNIKLKRGLSVSRGLWDWFMQGRYDERVKRINFSIIQGAPGHNMLTNAGVGGWQQAGAGFGKVKHWDVENAFPVKWEMSALSTASVKNVVIETLEVAHHGLSLSYEVGTPMSLVAGAIG
jgi:phage tail-like protein